MKIIYTSLFLIFFSQSSLAVDSKIVPMISSNPNTGTSLGVMNSLIYNTDEESSESQALILGQYSDTDSWNIIGINTSYFKNNAIKSFTVGGYLHNKSQLYIDIGGEIFPEGTKIDANFDADAYFIVSKLQHIIVDNFYFGGQFKYTNSTYKPTDQAGAIFLKSKGIEDGQTTSFGVIGTYDTIKKDEKLYPMSGVLIDADLNYSPENLGNSATYISTVINARKYSSGFKPNDVWANQLYGHYTSDDTPDSALPALGMSSVLRGFAIGQFKARYLTAAQTEYRYQIEETSFRLVTFLGAAILAGGSEGTGGAGNRDKDNGDYYSGGFGARYAIQKEAGVDYRIDVAYTSTDDYGIYAIVNQAF
jgi:hypothetical protein